MFLLFHPFRLIVLSIVVLLTSTAFPSAPVRRNVLADPQYQATIRTTVSPAVIDAAQPITITFVVMPSLAMIIWPTGVVTVTTSVGEPICVSASTSGSCTFTPTTRNPVTISYSGDANFAPSQVNVGVVWRVRTGLTVAVLQNPVIAGQLITLTAGITIDSLACKTAFFCTPTGQVSYTDNGQTIAIAGVHPRVGIVFPVTATLSLAGIHHISGYYSGDSRYTFSSSAPITVEALPLYGYVPLVVKP